MNIVTPLNSYLLIILAVLKKYRTGTGLGSLMALMVPYLVVVGLVWTAALLGWHVLGLPLGPGTPLHVSTGGWSPGWVVAALRDRSPRIETGIVW